jgi:hypothetical protein
MATVANAYLTIVEYFMMYGLTVCFFICVPVIKGARIGSFDFANIAVLSIHSKYYLPFLFFLG